MTSWRAPVTNEKRRPSPIVTIWLLVPKVVLPAAWLELIVSPVDRLAPVDWLAGSLPVAMIVGSAIRVTPIASTKVPGLLCVNIRNRFCPDGALARLNSRFWLVPMKTTWDKSRLTASSALPVSGCFSG